jgi:hypothetical protein
VPNLQRDTQQVRRRGGWNNNLEDRCHNAQNNLQEDRLLSNREMNDRKEPKAALSNHPLQKGEMIILNSGKDRQE